MKPIEEHLAEFVLGMVRTNDWRRYVKECLALWEQTHGQRTAERVRSIINARMREPKK